MPTSTAQIGQAHGLELRWQLSQAQVVTWQLSGDLRVNQRI